MIQKHAASFGHAWEGLVWAFKTQINYRIHISLIIVSVTAGILLDISPTEWLVVLVLSTLGLSIETINTAIEQLGDAVTQEYNKHIKAAKDVSAGAMLIYSVGAGIGGLIIFIPKIITVILDLI